MVPPLRALEISIISAHDLSLVSKTMKSYAVAWVDPDRKLTTGVDQTGLNNPVWNEKLVFRVDERFLADETSAIMIEIYAAAWIKDALIGSVRVLISHLLGTLTTHNNSSSTTCNVKLQVRRPSGRPQGIINLGVTLLDDKMRSRNNSTPLFAELCAGGGRFSEVSAGIRTTKDDQYLEKIKAKDNAKEKLRRCSSDTRTDSTTSEDCSKNNNHNNHDQAPAGSIVNGSICNGNSVVKESGCGGGSGSVVNGSLCNSDVGPSASVVAAAIARGLYKTPAHPKTSEGGGDNGVGGGSVLLLNSDELNAKESEEGMKSKVEMWRTELPPPRGNSKHGGLPRRRSDSGGLFSCFGNAFGCEISITCGGGNGVCGGGGKKKYQNGKVCHLSTVDDNYSQSYV